MLLFIAAVIAGLAILIWSADRFVDGAVAIAQLMGVSSLIIGITIIGFGTSAPEIVVSIISVLEQTPDLAIGNALGSNIANIGLILGFTAILAPIPIANRMLRSEYPILLFATAVMSWCLYDLTLDAFDGLLLLGMLALILFYLIRDHRKNPEPDEAEDSTKDEAGMTMLPAIGWLTLGLILLIGGSKLLVWGASNIALSFGVSDLVIGLTIVALGTSLPELAAAIASLKKGETDLVIGNVVGSNLFNSLAVIGLPAVLVRFNIDSAAFSRDVPVVIGFTLLMYLMSRFASADKRQLTRVHGILLFSGFVIYQLYLYYGAAINY
ncbi:MAG: cation:H+ antiporter [Planctomycetota bacterium]|jgi:cation:H+ antiporter